MNTFLLTCIVFSLIHLSLKCCFFSFSTSINHERLQLYKESIEFSGRPDQMPPLIMSAYFNKAIIAVGSSEFARSRILGTVHKRQEVTVFKDLKPLLRDHFQMATYAREYRLSALGVETDVVTEIHKDKEMLWQGVVTGLSMKNTKRIKNGTLRRKVTTDDFKMYKEFTIKSNSNTGIKFAHATQDYQPQHLYPLTSALVGFRKPIAHGLWTMAVAVENIMRNEDCFKDVYPINIETDFKRPLILGNNCTLQYEQPGGTNKSCRFRVCELDLSLPILHGKIYTGPKESRTDRFQ